MTLTAIDRLPLAEFVSAIEDSGFVCVLETAPLRERWLLEVSAPVALPIVDHLLGGSGAGSSGRARRPLTGIETRLLLRVAELATAALQSAWNGVCDLVPRIAEAGRRPCVATFGVHENEHVLLTFDLSVGEAVGGVNLCLPVAATDRLSVALGCDGPASGSSPATNGEQGGETDNGDAGAAAVNMVVRLATARLTADEIASLAVGDVIVSEASPQEPLSVLIDGEPRFAGFPGLVADRKAVRLAGSTGS
jgi:flagellar motor switch protein FliM